MNGHRYLIQRRHRREERRINVERHPRSQSLYNAGVIRVGPAGWNYRDWNGIVYPKPQPRGFDELTYISAYFDVIEINSSYYGPPRPASAKKWVESVSANPRFRFTAKLFHSFTHERQPAPNDEKEFKEGVEPIAEAGRLGGYCYSSLVPSSFRRKTGNT